MKVSKVIDLLDKLHELMGDVDLTVSDWVDCRTYRGEFRISVYDNEIDIGVGGCLEEQE
jgi:hypothetical protein